MKYKTPAFKLCHRGLAGCRNEFVELRVRDCLWRHQRRAHFHFAPWAIQVGREGRLPGTDLEDAFGYTTRAIAQRSRYGGRRTSSSHGGRQLDSAPYPILALRDIRAAVGPEFPLFFDSGIRSGEDVLKAYALGADCVFLGRSMLHSLAAGGQKGMEQMWDIFSDEISIAMAQLGMDSLKTRPTSMVPEGLSYS